MKGRNLLVFCDGTGNQYGKNNTNVVKLYSLANKDEKQLAFYDPGVGTGGWVHQENGELSTIRKISGFFSGGKKKYDLATGTGLQQNIVDAYRFLMKNYQEGDRIYLFGFSRGAFTARAVAGMLCKVGLLHADLDNLIWYAGVFCKIYSNDENHEINDEITDGFKKTFSHSCSAHFIGVWDTVESLHLNDDLKFRDNILHPDLKYGFHALSIDDKRKDFPPSLWDEKAKKHGQTIEQVWFPGAHSDVGGWYDECGLSNGALNWMAHNAVTHGLRLDLEELERKYPADPHDMVHEPHEERPWRYRGTHIRKIKQGAKVHHSAFQRKKAATKGYNPKNLQGNYREIHPKDYEYKK